jgi:hypothetical protein
VRFAGDALLASNGVAIPVDGLADRAASEDRRLERRLLPREELVVRRYSARTLWRRSC